MKAMSGKKRTRNKHLAGPAYEQVVASSRLSMQIYALKEVIGNLNIVLKYLEGKEHGSSRGKGH